MEIGIVIINVSATRINQITISFQNGIFKSVLKTIAPSILASSYNLDDVYYSYIKKPPSTMSKTSLVSENTSNAPVFAFKILSSPSLIGVPGEINFSMSVTSSFLLILTCYQPFLPSTL